MNAGKHALSVVLALTGALLFGKDVKWIGPAESEEARLDVAAQWEDGTRPGTGDTMVFDVDGDIHINNSNATWIAAVAGIKVLGGTVRIDGGTVKAGASDTVFTVDVATGAKLYANCYVNANSGTALNDFVKQGGGDFYQSWRFGYNYPWGTVEIRNGFFSRYAQSGHASSVTYGGHTSEFVVRDGAQFQVSAYNMFGSKDTVGGYPIVTVDEGGVFAVASSNSTNGHTVDGIRGGGRIVKAEGYTNSRLKIDLGRGSNSFSGTVENVTLEFLKASENRQIVAAAGALASAKELLGELSCLAFAPGIGTFQVNGLSGDSRFVVTTEDLAGKPIELVASAMPDVASTMELAVNGSGVFEMPDGPTITSAGSLTVTSGKVKFASASNKGTLAVTGGEVELDAIANSKTFSQTGGTVVGATEEECNVTEPMFTRPRPYGVVWTDDSTAAENDIAGGFLRLGGSTASKLNALTVRDGGVLELLTGWSAAENSAQEIALDGGTIRIRHNKAQAFNVPSNASAVDWKLKVGEKGARIDGEHEQTFSSSSSYRGISWYLTAETAEGLETDGGIEFAYPGYLKFYRSQAVSGPVAISDGFQQLEPGMFSEGLGGSVFGTGDFTLDCGWLQVDANNDQGLKLASGAGAKFTYGRSAALCTRMAGKAAGSVQTFTIGPADATSSPIVRKGKGSVLLLATGVTSSAPYVGDSKSGQTFVNGGVEVYENGLVKGPIFSYTRNGSSDSNYHYELMKYDAEKGLVEATDLYNPGLEGGADAIAYLNVATAEYAVPENETRSARAVVVFGSARTDIPLTVNAGAILKVGDGANPAPFILNRVGGYGGVRIDGSGTIDFGTSEGVFAVNNRTEQGDTYNTRINPVIAGSGGVTFYGALGASYPFVFVNNDNTYSGGTWITGVQIRPKTAGAFGTGLVDVGGSYSSGGQVRFVTDGLTFTNDFKLKGYGVKGYDNGIDYTDNGALFFAVSTKLTGAVEIDGSARVTTRNAEASVRGELAGVVSGGKLKLMRGGEAAVVLSNHNTYTGGTEVVASTLALKYGDSAGTGEIWADSSAIVFENADDIIVSNRFSATGTVKLRGEGGVKFADLGDVSGAMLDVDGGIRPLADLPDGFPVCTNSAALSATLVLAAGRNVMPCDLAGGFVLQVDSDAVLDLGGRTVTVKKIKGRGALDVVNGELIAPPHNLGLMMIVK